MKETEGSGASWSLEKQVLFLLTGKMAIINRMLLRVKGAAGD